MPQQDDAADAFTRLQDAAAPDQEALLVSGWKRDDWAALFAYTQPLPIAAGNVLIQKNEAKRTLYFVTSGLLEVSAVVGDYSLAPIAKIRPGSVVGELAFLDGKPRSAKVWAAVDSVLHRLEHEDFRRFVDASPARGCEFALGIGRIVALRLRRNFAGTAR